MPASEPTLDITRLQSDPSLAGFAALMSSAGYARLTATGWIRVRGEDRVRWLNGMVTNSIQALAAGEGCFNFLLSAQGRIQGTAYAFAEPDSLLLETDLAQTEPMMVLLDRFIIMDDVALENVSGEREGLVVAGPRAGRMLHDAGLLPEDVPELYAVDVSWQGAQVRLQRMPGPVVERYELWMPAEAMEPINAALRLAGATAAGDQSLEWLRMLEGRPRFGVDIRDRELAQETGQTDALHFSKGCYLGQEIVERIRSRGQVHRSFHGFSLEGSVPATKANLEAAGKTVGELTSAAWIPPFAGYADGLALGLGYLRREALEQQQELAYVTENGSGVARPVSLPIRLGPASQTHPTA